ncbi:hypothetical protein P4767_16310, partial [Listeria monocytogenes]|nr:hypothetical protein [Listeria monocytogenes]MDF7961336.1 hypothetical protein [Listeria monocytogenes]MDF8029877.1 hypothetical protein [Listeria monocytogenes]MDF8038852.1 hypothetical protein [Listeria monocytogenes]MDF8050996.1 hypothetical protein [Listeria monocytogenes]
PVKLPPADKYAYGNITCIPCSVYKVAVNPQSLVLNVYKGAILPANKSDFLKTLILKLETPGLITT